MIRFCIFFCNCFYCTIICTIDTKVSFSAVINRELHNARIVSPYKKLSALAVLQASNLRQVYNIVIAVFHIARIAN